MADCGSIIRKGSVYIRPCDLSVIPPRMTGDVALVRATKAVDSFLRSSSRGTGRRMSRSECKPMADAFDFEALRRAMLFWLVSAIPRTARSMALPQRSSGR